MNGCCDGFNMEKGGKDNLQMYKQYNRATMGSAWGEGMEDVKVGN